MKLGNFCWWLVFFIVGVWLQYLLPGIDVLVVALLLALQEKKPWQILWLGLALIAIQEGAGSLDFGSSLLWYCCVVSFFYIGRWLFETENFLFVFILSGCLGITHGGIVWLMAKLQDLSLDMPSLWDEGILQALFITVAWKIGMVLRQPMKKHENTA